MEEKEVSVWYQVAIPANDKSKGNTASKLIL